MLFENKVKTFIANLFIILFGWLMYKQSLLEEYQFYHVFDKLAFGMLIYSLVMFCTDLFVLLFIIKRKSNNYSTKSEFVVIVLFELMMFINNLMIILNGTNKMKSLYAFIQPITIIIHFHTRFFRDSYENDFEGNIIDNFISMPSKLIKKFEQLCTFDVMFIIQLSTILFHIARVYFLITH